MPDLLPPDSLDVVDKSPSSSSSMMPLKGLGHMALLSLTVMTKEGDDEETLLLLQFSASFGEAVVNHARLWFPDVVHEESAIKYVVVRSRLRCVETHPSAVFFAIAV